MDIAPKATDPELPRPPTPHLTNTFNKALFSQMVSVADLYPDVVIAQEKRPFP